VSGVANNLPAQLTAFIGRERELDELRSLITSSRILTLNGTGGCGKTRLAQQLATEVIDRYEGGVWQVELALVVDPDRVSAALAQALGEPDLTGDLVEAIVVRLADRDTLIVLDNCEHLLEPVARLVDTLLRRCPRLTIVATSREPLGVPGEVAWRVPSLAAPTNTEETSAEAASHYDSVRLFVERAGRARPNFRLTDDNAAAVAQICHRLDGIPLAIELAAARVRGMTAEQVADGLDDRFRLLTGGARTVLPRQQTLQASVDWGYELLTDAERAVFRRLTVFAGGFTLDAAEAVVPGEPVDSVEILGVLLALVDKSFVVTADETNRYSLLETLRQYGSARLLEAGETASLRALHLEWAAGLLDAVRTRTTGRLDDVMPLAEQEIDNLRAAFEWAAISENADAACTLASTITGWEGDLGDAAEAVRVGRRAIELPDGQLRLRLLVQAILVWAYFELGDHDAAAAMCDTLRERLPELDEDDVVRISCLRMSTFSVKHAGYLRGVLDEALALAERAGEPGAAALCASMLAAGAAWRGDVPAALDFLARADPDPNTVSGRNVLMSRGSIAIATGRFDEARAVTDELRGVFLERQPRLLVYVEAQRVYVDLAQGVDSGAATRIADVIDNARRRRFLSGVASGGWAPGAWALAHGHVWTALEELTAWQAQQTGYTLGRQWLGVYVHALLADERVDEAGSALTRARERFIGRPDLDLAAVRSTALEALVARARGDLASSEPRAHDALATQHAQGWRPEVAHSLEALAGIAAANESYTEAARLAGAAQRLRDEMGYVLRWPYEQKLLDADLGAARVALGEDAFTAAWAEGLALDEASAVAYAQRARGERKRPSAGWASLTPVEGEVVRLVAEGLTNKQVGDALFIGAETVKTHLSHVYDKLGIRGRTALATQFADQNEATTSRP